MLARRNISRGSSQWLAQATSSQRRGMAAVTNPFHYTVGEAAGIKVASRDDGGPATNLAIVVRGGTRYESVPGVAHGLEKFAFKNTTRRSSLRLQRESELLGGILSSSLSRENIVLRAKFLRDDLPYFVEALGDVLTKTKYIPHEFDEQVSHTMSCEAQVLHKTPSALSIETAHSVAFHRGLGSPTVALTNRYLNNISIPAYASTVYAKSNIAVVASGTSQSSLEKWTTQFLSDVPAGSGPPTAQTKYYGGENRVYSTLGNALTIAFNAPVLKPEYTVIGYLLSGESTIKWSPGSSFLSQAVAGVPGVTAVTKHVTYTDAGLLYITLSGSAGALENAGKVAVDAVNRLAAVKADDIKKAIAQAKFDVLAAEEDRFAGLEAVGQAVIKGAGAPQVEGAVKGLEAVTLESVKKAVKAMLAGKASFGAVGDLHVLPYAEDIGLNV